MSQSNVVKLPRAKPARELPIKSQYWLGKEVVKTNSSSNPLRCVSRCVEHLRLNSYSATHAEVVDSSNGKLHAVIRRSVDGNIRILYERKLQDNEVR